MAEISEIQTDPETGKEFYVYDNGGQKWKDTGYWKSPPPAYIIKSPEQARDVVNQRWSRVKEVSRAGTLEGFIEKGVLPSTAQPLDELRAIAKLNAFEIVSGSANRKAEHLRFAYDIGGYEPKRHEVQEPQGYTDPASATAALVELLNILRAVIEPTKPDVIEGKVTPTTGE